MPVQNGRYSVRLHFAELNKFSAGARVFSVDVEGKRFLTDLDVFAAAGGADKAIVRTVTTDVTDGVVNLDFLANVQYAKVSAIEILPLDSTAPDVVTGLVGGGTEAAATVSWAASSASDLAGYNVSRSATADGTYVKVNSALLTATTYADATAPVGTGVFYRVTAVDTSGNESVRSAAVAAARLADTTPPAVVTGLVGGGTEAAATVSWAASSASDLAGYNVYRSATADGTYAKVNTALLTGLSYTDSTAPVGVGVFYRVTAVDTSGNESVRSAAVAAARLADTTPPAVVTGLTGTATTAGNSLTWTASTASDLAGYAVLRADTPTGTYTRLTPALLTGTAYTDTAAPDGLGPQLSGPRRRQDGQRVGPVGHGHRDPTDRAAAPADRHPGADPDQRRRPCPDGERDLVVRVLLDDRLLRVGQRRARLLRAGHHHRDPGRAQQHDLPVRVDRDGRQGPEGVRVRRAGAERQLCGAPALRRAQQVPGGDAGVQRRRRGQAGAHRPRPLRRRRRRGQGDRAVVPGGGHRRGPEPRLPRRGRVCEGLGHRDPSGRHHRARPGHRPDRRRHDRRGDAQLVAEHGDRPGGLQRVPLGQRDGHVHQAQRRPADPDVLRGHHRSLRGGPGSTG